MVLMDMNSLMLLIILGCMLAILYVLRVMVIMEREIANLELYVEKIVEKMYKEELKLEKEEEQIEKEIKQLLKKRKR